MCVGGGGGGGGEVFVVNVLLNKLLNIYSPKLSKVLFIIILSGMKPLLSAVPVVKHHRLV